MSHIFPRTSGPPRTAVAADGVWITDADGKRYLDGCGGAIVVNIGHGVAAIQQAMSAQAEKISYVHATDFTTEAVEQLGSTLAPYVPMDAPAVYPVSGGGEAIETAFKMARSFHLANGHEGRHKIIARLGSYHGNTVGALDASGRAPLRAPYLPWLDKAIHVPPVYEYRCSMSQHPVGCGRAHADVLERVILEQGPDTVAAFVAEPIVGATLGAAVPPDDYWPAVAEVCSRHGVLLIADEVMTGFGRTGTWFGVDHWGIHPDIIASAKGCSAGYWPLGLAIASGEVAETLGQAGFVHGFTYSHHAVGAAVGTAVVERLVRDGLVERSRIKGERLKTTLEQALGDHRCVGDIRGRGLLVGLELVAQPDSKQPFPRSDRMAERVVEACMQRGLMVYPNTGFLGDDGAGDLILIGPPFVITDEEMDQMVEIISSVLAEIETLPPA